MAVLRAGSKQKMVLNSSDKLFADLRDASFAAVGPRLGEKAKVIQTNYQGSKVGAVCTMLQPRACLVSCSACIQFAAVESVEDERRNRSSLASQSLDHVDPSRREVSR